MFYVGIDPGKKGGIAVITPTEIAVYPYSDDTLRIVVSSLTHEACRCCLEQIHSMPKQGVKSTFALGASYGYIKGVLESFGISYQEIHPQRWKKEYGLNSDKSASIDICKRLFPEAKLRGSDRCRVDNDGMAEALLMAEYARRKL